MATGIYQSLDFIALVVGIASFISAITIIWAKLKSIKSSAVGTELKPILDKLNVIEDKSDQHYLEILKLMITNTEINPQERMRAYTKYKTLGGNGTIDIYVKKVLSPILEKEYKQN
jgi:hypothetical protein